MAIDDATLQAEAEATLPTHDTFMPTPFTIAATGVIEATLTPIARYGGVAGDDGTFTVRLEDERAAASPPEPGHYRLTILAGSQVLAVGQGQGDTPETLCDLWMSTRDSANVTLRRWVLALRVIPERPGSSWPDGTM